MLSPYVVGIRDIPFGSTESPGPHLDGIYWTGVTDGVGGLALLNRGLQGSVIEGDGALSAVLAFSLPYVWGTRVPSGTFRYELALWPFRGPSRDADIDRRALEYNLPFVAQEVGDGGPAAAPSVASPPPETSEVPSIAGPLTVPSTCRAILSAFYTLGGRHYVRFHEPHGLETTVSVAWRGRAVDLEPVDLRHRASGMVSRAHGLPPWHAQTFRLIA